MRPHAGTLLRAIATALTLAAERLDPQPSVDWPASFTAHHDYTVLTANPTPAAWRLQLPDDRTDWHARF